MFDELISQYEAGGDKLRRAYTGLTDEQLHAMPIPGTWSLHQIAIHMMDSDLIGSDRMKRVASMTRPLLCGYDETAFNQLPGIEKLNAHEAVEMFVINRRMTSVILRSLPAESFDRFGIHDEVGKVTLKDLIEKYIHHLDGHMIHVEKKRTLVTSA